MWFLASAGPKRSPLAFTRVTTDFFQRVAELNRSILRVTWQALLGGFSLPLVEYIISVVRVRYRLKTTSCVVYSDLSVAMKRGPMVRVERGRGLNGKDGLSCRVLWCVGSCYRSVLCASSGYPLQPRQKTLGIDCDMLCALNERMSTQPT